MSMNPARPVEVWRSSRATELGEINGAFAFPLVQTLMVAQTIEFLNEEGANRLASASDTVARFLRGAGYGRKDALLYWMRFESAEALFDFEFSELVRALKELELLVDINLTFSEVSYLADVGMGPTLPLLVYKRSPFSRAVGFEIHERGAVRELLKGPQLSWTDAARVSQQHYSVGMGLLAFEDVVAGVIDAAFMQFYLATEAVLGAHERSEALANGATSFGSNFSAALQAAVGQVYIARHRFFGHAHPKVLSGHIDPQRAFQVTKQTLVARWCARKLISLALGRDLVARELRLYPGPGSSVEFTGTLEELSGPFAMPE